PSPRGSSRLGGAGGVAGLLSGTVTLRGAARGEPTLEPGPDQRPAALEVALVGRERVHVFSREGAVPATVPVVIAAVRVSGRDGAGGAGAEPAVFAFDLPLPAWLPSSAAPRWGAVDYRVVARFLSAGVPALEDLAATAAAAVAASSGAGEGGLRFEVGEFAAQKAVAVVRTHGHGAVPAPEMLMPMPMQPAPAGWRVARTVDGGESFEVRLAGPERIDPLWAAVDVAVAVRATAPGHPPPRRVRVFLAQLCKYTFQQQRHGALVPSEKLELAAVAESGGFVSLDAGGSVRLSVPLAARGPAPAVAAGADGDDAAALLPRVQGVNLEVTHQLVVEVGSSGGDGGGGGGSGGGSGFFKALAAKVAVPAATRVERAGFPVTVAYGGLPPKIGRA
ncbi:hypothetical protein HK405_007011, partial [Cladochytrium tenue]